MGRTTGTVEAGRLEWADVAKGISIILVVMMHSVLGTQETMQASGWLGPVVEFARPFRIPAFFMLAGFFFAGMLRRSWGEVLDRRVLHFVYFLMLWSVILMVVKGGFLALGSPAAALGWVVMSLIEPSGSLWFIHALALFAVVARLTATMPAPAVLAAAAILHLVAPETGWTALDEFASRYVFFIIGCRFAPMVAEFAADARARTVLSLAIVMVTAMMIAMSVWPARVGFAGGAVATLPAFSLMLGLFGALSLIIVAVHLARFRFSRMLGALGRKSLVIYLAFTIPMAATRMVLVKTGIIADVGLVSLIVTLAAILVPLLMELAARRAGASFLFERPGWVRLRERRAAPRLQVA